MKKIIILLIPFLLTGCASVSYNLDITKNLSVEEEIFVSGTADYFANFYKNFPITIVNEWYQNNEDIALLNQNNYSHEIITEDVYYPGLLAKKQYNTLSEYTNNTIFKGQAFENIVCITNDNLITLKTINFLPYTEDETGGRYSISKLAINIKLPYVVTNNNADSYDPKTNTYTWYVDKETKDKEINLTFDKNKIYVYNLVMYISIFIIILLLIILIFVIKKLINKNKINNKISE